MGTFTIPLKKVIEYTGGVITRTGPVTIMTGGDIGLNDYPCIDEDTRIRLNGKIIDHFYNQEIGDETIDIWQLAMRRFMNEQMPYFNQMYSSEQIAFDPLATVNMRTLSLNDTTQTGSSNGESISDGEVIGGARTVNLETPQTALSADKDYAASGVDVNSKTTNAATGTQTETSEQTANGTGDSTTTGFSGIASQLLMSYRASLLNIDLSVINAMEDACLFMGIWDNGDSYTNRNGYSL